MPTAVQASVALDPVSLSFGAVPAGSGNPSVEANWPGGYFCPCHGSTFDGAGRVYKNKPAPTNLEVPPHRYVSDTRILIGEDDAKA